MEKELDQIWANEPGSFLRVVENTDNGAITLEWRTGPQGSVAASTCRASLELTSYRAKRLADVLSACSQKSQRSAGEGE